MLKELGIGRGHGGLLVAPARIKDQRIAGRGRAPAIEALEDVAERRGALVAVSNGLALIEDDAGRPGAGAEELRGVTL